MLTGHAAKLFEYRAESLRRDDVDLELPVHAEQWHAPGRSGVSHRALGGEACRSASSLPAYATVFSASWNWSAVIHLSGPIRGLIRQTTMCGICGIVYPVDGRSPSERQLLDMRDILTHRGPDDAGMYRAPGIVLGARRLAILDLSPSRPHADVHPRWPVSHRVQRGGLQLPRAPRRFSRRRAICSSRTPTPKCLLRLYEVLGPDDARPAERDVCIRDLGRTARERCSRRATGWA